MWARRNALPAATNPQQRRAVRDGNRAVVFSVQSAAVGAQPARPHAEARPPARVALEPIERRVIDAKDGVGGILREHRAALKLAQLHSRERGGLGSRLACALTIVRPFCACSSAPELPTTEQVVYRERRLKGSGT